jgi:lipoprotein signal peptidase
MKKSSKRKIRHTSPKTQSYWAKLIKGTPQRPFYRVIIFGWFTLTLILDQATKLYAESTGVVHINPGISFGLFPSIWMSLLLVAVFIWFFEWTCGRWHAKYPVAMGVLLGAAMSNIIDRFLVGGVVDFLPIPLTNLTNNVADWLIFISLGFILAKEWVQSTHE